MHSDPPDRTGTPTELAIVGSYIITYLSTFDVVRISATNRTFRDTVFSALELRKHGIECVKGSVISNQNLDILYIHNCVDTYWALLANVRSITESNIVIEKLVSTTSEVDAEVWSVILNSDQVFHFSSNNRFLCQFFFDGSQVCADGSGQFSNTVAIPGGTLKLFRRTLSSGNSLFTASESTQATALGVSFESDEVWIVRVAAVTGTRRVDIKAGATRADVLRVPNAAKGTWSDLLPVDAHFCDLEPGGDKTVFLIEFI